MKININFTIEGSGNECAGFVELLLGDRSGINQFFAKLEESDLKIKTHIGSGTENESNATNPFTHVSWSSIHLFDVIRIHHTSERSDVMVMTEAQLEQHRLAPGGTTFNKDQLSRIIGGARQTTNKLDIPPILEIQKISGIKEFCAYKRALPQFNEYMDTWQSTYHKELKERGFFLPGM